jgi:hypothetical protein
MEHYKSYVITLATLQGKDGQYTALQKFVFTFKGFRLIFQSVDTEMSSAVRIAGITDLSIFRNDK